MNIFNSCFKICQIPVTETINTKTQPTLKKFALKTFTIRLCANNTFSQLCFLITKNKISILLNSTLKNSSLEAKRNWYKIYINIPRPQSHLAQIFKKNFQKNWWKWRIRCENIIKESNKESYFRSQMILSEFPIRSEAHLLYLGLSNHKERIGIKLSVENQKFKHSNSTSLAFYWEIYSLETLVKRKASMKCLEEVKP
mgnify:FL=1